MWNTPPLSSSSINGYMSSTHYSKLDNLYTKSEIDTLIENSSSGSGNNYGTDFDRYEEIYLGDHVTETQSANIANGSFDGLPLGAYWTINNIKYRILSQDQYYLIGFLGNYNGIYTHHVVVMPDDIYKIPQMYNNTETSNDCYYGSNVMRPYIENTYNPMIINAFGENHILSHTHDLTSGTYKNGTLVPTDNTKAWLINSYNVNGTKYEYETDYSWKISDMKQFPAFKYSANLKYAKYNGSGTYRGSNYTYVCHYWLSTTNMNYYICFNAVNRYGGMDYSRADSSTYANQVNSTYKAYGVRPAFLVY